MQVIISKDNNLISKNDRIIIPEYYYKCCLSNEQLDESIDYTYTYKLSREEKNYLYDLCYRIIDSIKKVICDYYHISVSSKQLLFTISYAIINYEFWLYEKYIKIKMIKEKFPNVYTLSYKNNSRKFECIKFKDVNNLLEDDEYNLFIYIKICEQLNIDINYIEPNELNFEIKKCNNKKSIASLFKKIFKYNIISILFDSDKRYVITSYIRNKFQSKKYLRNIPKTARVLLLQTYIPRKLMKRIIKQGNKQVVEKDIYFFHSYEDRIVKTLKGNFNIRENALKYFDPKDDFEKIIKCNIMDTIPKIALEYFDKCYNVAEDFVKNSPMFSKIYSAAGIGCFDSSTIVNIIASIYNRNGCRIIDIQHSAGYGVIKNLNEQEMIYFDEFVTWGWNEESNNKIRPCRNIRFVSDSNAYKNKFLSDKKSKRELLYVTDGVYKYNSLGKHSDNFVEKHIEFVKKLPHQIRKNMTVRLRNNNFHLEERYKNEFPEIEIEWMTDSFFAESIIGRKLVIVDSNSSPFYECLMNYIPTILYEAYSFEEYTESMKVFYNKLFDVNMYYRDAIECVKNVKRIFDEDKLFWTDDRKKIATQIVDYYFNEKADYVSSWLNEFLYL